MAISLFKYIRGKLREREAQKAVPTIDDSHLVPECTSAHELQDGVNNHNHTTSKDPTGSHIKFLAPKETAQQKAQDRKNKIRQWKLLLGLVLPNFLAAMDVTIVAPAIPLISSHFGTSILQDDSTNTNKHSNTHPQTSSLEASIGS